MGKKIISSVDDVLGWITSTMQNQRLTLAQRYRAWRGGRGASWDKDLDVNEGQSLPGSSGSSDGSSF